MLANRLKLLSDEVKSQLIIGAPFTEAARAVLLEIRATKQLARYGVALNIRHAVRRSLPQSVMFKATRKSFPAEFANVWLNVDPTEPGDERYQEPTNDEGIP